MNTTNIWQLKNGLYIEPKIAELGGHYVYSDYIDNDDPNKIDPAIMQEFEGNPQNKIPNHLWNKMVTFFVHYLEQRTEVECRYYKRGSNFICVVGSQLVTGGSVAYNYNLPFYDLDGVLYTRESLVDNGWILYGQFHLHPFDMPSPSSVDDTNEMKTPLLYGIISIPHGRLSTMDYRIRTTLVANNGHENYRYFPQSWDFIDLPINDELQTYTHTAYAPICESQVKRMVYRPQQVTYAVGSTKWLQPIQSGVTAKSLSERLVVALRNILLADSKITVGDIEKELPAVLSELLTEDSKYSELFTYDVDVADPYYYRCD